MQKILVLGLLVAVLLSACAAPAANQQVSDEEQSLVVSVYRSPT
jgi:PBP1b-binding outer membrane lipoprotein LpoB